MSFVRSACLCLLSWDRRDARTRQCITTVQRGKKFTGGETIDLQSLRETICDALRETAAALLDTGGLWRRGRLVSGDPQTQDPLILEYHIRATHQAEEEEWRNLESRRQIEIFAPWSNAPQRIPYVVGGRPLSLR